MAVFVVAVLAACGAAPDEPRPAVSIETPTNEPTYRIQATAIRLGGTISGASFVRATNRATGFTEQGFVNYFQGQGSWFVDVALQVGVNVIIVTADADGTGNWIATDRIDVTRLP